MKYPEPKFRSSTREAIDSLASRFKLRNDPGMQDWEYEVADPNRIDEFISAYESGELSDDEKFTLMETIIQSFEELDSHLNIDNRWKNILGILRENINLHSYTIWYWSFADTDQEKDRPKVSSYMRKILDEQNQ